MDTANQDNDSHPSTPENTPSRILDDLPLTEAKQSVLKDACSRRKLSTTGRKNILAERLAKAGFKDINHVRRLAAEFKKYGPDDTATVTGREKAANFTTHEYARLCHVIQHPSNSTAVARLYNKPKSRAELDKGRHDPFANEFADLFNEQVKFVLPEPRDGITADVLDAFDPNDHPHKRQGAILKVKWNELRSKYSTAYQRFSRSGQGDPEAFPNFIGGDTKLSYMHCVFIDSPAIGYATRLLPRDAQVEEGICDVDDIDGTEYGRGKKRKATSSPSLSTGLMEIAKSLKMPVENAPPTVGSSKINELDMSNRIATTAVNLLGLEKELRNSIKEAEKEGDIDFASVLRSRLSTVQSRIEETFRT